MDEPDTNPEEPLPDQQTRWVRYRLIHIVYVVTVLAVSIATFGPNGLWLGVAVCVFWAVIFVRANRPKVFLEAILVVLVCGFLSTCLIPAWPYAREAARRMACSNNLKQIALALHNYHDDYRAFPPAYVTDAQGNPMHSWRVLILPYVENQPLYDKYKFDEPWDGPNNSKLLTQMPRVFRCPSAIEHGNSQDMYTSYCAIVGDRTVWPPGTSGRINQILDGVANTLLVFEHEGNSILWLEPRDLAFDEALQTLADVEPRFRGNHRRQTFLFDYPSHGRNVAFADGSIHFLPASMAEEEWISLLDVNDIKAFDHDRMKHRTLPDTGKRLRVGNFLRAALLTLLTLLPLPWVWINPTSGRPDKSPTPPTVA